MRRGNGIDSVALETMYLSRKNINSIPSTGVAVPPAACFDLPEKVLQFGTSALLRGLADAIIDSANRQGTFNGRVVAIGRAGTQQMTALQRQDSLYTICNGSHDHNLSTEKKYSINAAISRVLKDRIDWDAILRCAANPLMQIILSDTTPTGITLTKDNVHASPPQSFPGKLLAFLYQRFKIFHGDPSKGMVIIPMEPIPGNGEKLEAIVLELAHQNGLETACLDWLENSNYFCNSMAERTIKDQWTHEQKEAAEAVMGYRDELMLLPARKFYWAIESAEAAVKEILAFSQADSNIMIVSDMNKLPLHLQKQW